jgi:hypothetical protein
LGNGVAVHACATLQLLTTATITPTTTATGMLGLACLALLGFACFASLAMFCYGVYVLCFLLWLFVFCCLVCVRFRLWLWVLIVGRFFV